MTSCFMNPENIWTLFHLVVQWPTTLFYAAFFVHARVYLCDIQKLLSYFVTSYRPFCYSLEFGDTNFALKHGHSMCTANGLSKTPTLKGFFLVAIFPSQLLLRLPRPYFLVEQAVQPLAPHSVHTFRVALSQVQNQSLALVKLHRVGDCPGL